MLGRAGAGAGAGCAPAEPTVAPQVASIAYPAPASTAGAGQLPHSPRGGLRGSARGLRCLNRKLVHIEAAGLRGLRRPRGTSLHLPRHVTFVERSSPQRQGARKGGREEGPSEHLPRPTDSVLTDSGEVGETKHAQCTKCGQLGQERPNRKRARQNSKLTEAETRKKGNKDKTPSDSVLQVCAPKQRST